jgi:integrase
MNGSTFKRCGCRDPETGVQRGSACPDLRKKSHGAWWARFSAPVAADGKRRQPRLGPFRTKEEAEAALAQELAKLARGEYVSDRRITVGTYLSDWLDAKVDIKATTLTSYREAADHYLIPGLGHLRLVDLRAHHISELYAAMLRINRPQEGERPTEMDRRIGAVRTWRTSTPLASSRVRRVHAVLNAALNAAVKSQLLAHNQAAHVVLPRVRRVRPMVWTAERVVRWRQTGGAPSSVMVWTPQQTGEFLDFAADERLYPLYHLVAFRGLRRGEAAALPWSETDLGAGTITVAQTWSSGATDPGDPKSDYGSRTITLDTGTIDVLRRWRKQQAAERLAIGSEWVDSGLVFTEVDGAPLRANYVSERFVLLVRKSKLPPIRFHDLRHGAATLSLAAGVPMKVVSDTLGHATSAFTSDVYTSVVPEVAKEAAEAVAAIVPRAGRIVSEVGMS